MKRPAFKKYWLGVAFFLGVFGWQMPAYAVRSYTVAWVTPTPPAYFDMGVTNTGTVRITNTGNQDTITVIRFRLNNGDHFAGTITAPAGWTRTLSSASGGGYNTVTFTATSTANGIPNGGGFRDFNLAIMMHSLSADANERMRDTRATFTSGFGGNTRMTTSNQPTWTLKSLVMTLTPSPLSVPRNCVGAFTLTMQVTNRSTASITGVTSNPKPPTLNSLSGGATATTTSNPTNLNLAPGATGTQVWTYNTGANSGTISFTTYADDSGAGTRSSRTITSPVITLSAVSCLIADLAVVAPTPVCKFTGDTVTFTMQVRNNTGVTVTNVTPSALTASGTATVSSISGPTPASVASLANGALQNFTYTAVVSGNAYDTFSLSGNATASGGYTSLSTSTTVDDINSFLLSGAPDVNGDSTNQEMVWSIVNHGCNSVRVVSIPIPAGFIWNGDAYSDVYTGVGVSTESWTSALSGSNVIFTAPAGSEMAVDVSPSTFSLTMSTPSVSVVTPVTLTATVTDTNSTPRVRTVSDPTPINISPFNSGATNPNRTQNDAWREILP